MINIRSEALIEYVSQTDLKLPAFAVIQVSGEASGRIITVTVFVHRTERLEAEKRAEQERLAEEQRKAEEARLAAEKAEAEKAAQQNTLADTPSETKITTDYHLSLRANLLRWATLTPDLGVEWRICPSRRCIAGKRLVDFMDGGATRTGRYALWEVAPECVMHNGLRRKPGIWVYVQGQQ